GTRNTSSRLARRSERDRDDRRSGPASGRPCVQRVFAIVAAVGLIGTACTGGGAGDQPEGALESEAIAEPVSDGTRARRVQDLLVVTGLRTLDEQGEAVELLDEVLDELGDGS